ncbi:hypothetical protein EX30DRAFT_398035 [Ascodesmis nigricans]|uniref:Uncharacterized protein n=1 Tax=Ascodesmis nigricans TaxID=341454 RepID=A0A4S2MM56_9PEZI|nr:hypothetical protein EX30DRAFT_398035 [Ascodesmis nigricans]
MLLPVSTHELIHSLNSTFELILFSLSEIIDISLRQCKEHDNIALDLSLISLTKLAKTLQYHPISHSQDRRRVSELLVPTFKYMDSLFDSYANVNDYDLLLLSLHKTKMVVKLMRRRFADNRPNHFCIPNCWDLEGLHHSVKGILRVFNTSEED